MASTYGAQEMLQLVGGGVVGMAGALGRCTAQHSELHGVQTQLVEQGGDRDGLQVLEELALHRGKHRTACHTFASQEDHNRLP